MAPIEFLQGFNSFVLNWQKQQTGGTRVVGLKVYEHEGVGAPDFGVFAGSSPVWAAKTERL